MKKIIAALLCVCVAWVLTCFFGCAQTESVTCYVPDGAPALAVAKIMSEGHVGSVPTEVVVTTGEETSAKCVSGEADLAILPTNAAVKICSTRNDYCIFSVNVYGLLYVVGNVQVESLQQLKGSVVYSIGLGNTPEFVFKKVLDSQNVAYENDSNDAEKVNFKYETDGATIIPLVLQGKANFAVLGEPAVSNLIAKAALQNKTVYRLFDLQQLWKAAVQSDVAGYPQASLVVKKSLLKGSFAKELKNAVFANAEFLNANLENLNTLMQQHGSSLDVNYTAEIISRCNLVAVLAQDAKQDIEKYLQTFSGMNNLLPVKSSVYYEQND